jgi:Zn-dependent protease/CBS domain-containing protein
VSARLRIGQVWGIPIWLHATWFPMFALVTWSLAAGYFPSAYPGWRPGTYWLIGAVAAILFFASILVHELGHSRIALSNGVPIRGITLFVFGGIAQTRGEPPSAAVELRIAVAGPLTSLLLAAVFGVVGLAAAAAPTIAAPALWLARFNAVVALFNLAPGYPLDGGRVLRAALWWWTGNVRQATRTASATGQVLAFGLIGLGVLVLLRGETLQGIWLVLIGWFLQNAAAASAAEANLSEVLESVTVGQAMTRDCRRVPPDWTLERLVQQEILGAGHRCFVVTVDGRLRGLVTLHEIRAVPRDRWAALRIGDVMTPAEKLTVVSPHEGLLVALQRMDDANVAQLPVLEGDELVGMIGREQVVRYVRLRAELGV